MKTSEARPPFQRVLVANRGEIACRIIRSLHQLEVEAVAVYSEADQASTHVTMADLAICIGPPPASQSYLDIDAVLNAANETGCEAVHPGYGLLSESVEFAQRCEQAGIAFIGPTVEQIKQFGLKHSARAIAVDAQVPLVPGSETLDTADQAVAAAKKIGFPVMVKASAGGGGIGMRCCHTADEVEDAFASIQRLAANNFGDSTIFLERYVEKARHIEVQIFGDGNGQIVDLGERDCSIQRRHQKVIEESPAPTISTTLRDRLLSHARELGAAVNYRSAGTVEFIVDGSTLDQPDGGDAWFLEVNTRLQVEHGVTELIYGVDLVEWMVTLAAGQPLPPIAEKLEATGVGLEVRLYAEDPGDEFSPSSGLLTEFSVPETIDGTAIRCDTWVRAGTTISPYYDPLLAKLLIHGPDRDHAIDTMIAALEDVAVGGVATNRGFALNALRDERFRSGDVFTELPIDRRDPQPSLKVIEPGLYTTIQELPGRIGLWHVGVPPSGPMDDKSFRLANQLVGNDPETAALELTRSGPTLQFRSTATFVLGGAEFDARLDGIELPWWTVIEAPADSTLSIGSTTGAGMRGVVAIAGGIDVPDHLDSKSTFVLGGFGGHGGRTLQPGDVLTLATKTPTSPEPAVGAQLPLCERPELSRHWTIGALAGPHAAPDYFTPEDIEVFYQTEWEVHFNSDRTGVRLVGPTPTWARLDGGEAGLHPSNIHDNAYAVGTVDFTGDMPIILGRDGPSLGGFVCPATIASAEFWKVGQARPGDTIRFVPVHDQAIQPSDQPKRPVPKPQDPVLHRHHATGEPSGHPGMTIRRDGDRNVLVEYGENVLDLMLRLRVGALSDALEAQRTTSESGNAIAEVVPGIRSLQVGFDPDRLSARKVVDFLVDLDASIGDLTELQVPSRVVRLPLSWDDPATQLATQKYMQTVRPDAPWCPSNLEFIRRINGLASVDDVKTIVFDASYLVLGLGDVYLGAPVATPIDPRHRLVTTKYNPARTWTAENSVGIGGAYLCIYGMEGPGGYQFVGRTIPVWERWLTGTSQGFAQPWLLRYFDQIQWYPVSAEELLGHRADVEAGQFTFDITDTTFSVAGYLDLLADNADEIDRFTDSRERSFEEERQRWTQAGIDVVSSEEPVHTEPVETEVPSGHSAVQAAIPGVVWKIPVAVGESVSEGDVIVIIESMKMETTVTSACSGTVTEIRCAEGDTTRAGQVLAVIEPDADESR